MAADPRIKRVTLLATILGSSIVFLDGTVVNVALPAIRDDLDTGLAAQQWIVEAYLLTLGALLLLGGSLGDLRSPEAAIAVTVLVAMALAGVALIARERRRAA
jgi:MFS family permease